MIVANGETALKPFLQMFIDIIIPACVAFKDYGFCRLEQKHNFLHGLHLFEQSIQSTDKTLGNMVTFEVDHMLYKGHLLVPHQIVESSRLVDRVRQVEKYFSRWLRHMEIILVQGQQIRRDPIDVGPHNELEYWQQNLTRYTSVVEFVSSKPFLNHLACLIQSKSKLVKKWKKIDNELTSALFMAQDNVRYVGSLNRYWDPLYRCSPERIPDYLKSLILSLRNVYLTSRYFNTTMCMASFLVKTTNQLTIACQEYLTCHETIPIFEQNSAEVMRKIEVCEILLNRYREIYYETVAEMAASEFYSELAWDCSPIFIFGIMDMFMERVKKIKQIIEVKVTYSVLNRIRISGMETFEKIISDAHEKMVSRPYRMLDPR